MQMQEVSMTKNGSIGVDIDGVCCDWVSVAANIIALEYDIRLEVIYDFLGAGLPLPDWLEEKFAEVAEKEKPYRVCAPHLDSRYYLRMLYSRPEPYQIFYVTHRNRRLVGVTEDWLWRHGFPRWNKVYYTDGKSKVDYARELKLDIFVEDRVDVAEELINVVPNVILITRPWNEKVQTSLPIQRFNSWFDIYYSIIPGTK